MQPAYSHCNNENRLEKYRRALIELTQERAALLNAHQDVMTQLAILEKRKQHTGVMLKAMDKAILDVASYIDDQAA